jgi:Amt family ammonium transporter
MSDQDKHAAGEEPADQRHPAAGAPRPPAGSAGAEFERVREALRQLPIALYVQRLVPLIKGGGSPRFEVLLRSRATPQSNEAPHKLLHAAVAHGLGSMIDRRVVTELVSWLVRHPQAWRDVGGTFSVNLTKTAVDDEHFAIFVGLCLEKADLPRGTLAFEVGMPTAGHAGGRLSELAAALHGLGCPVVLDDFDLRTECFALLRLPGVKMLKLMPALTARMRSDKVCQAGVTAVVQMARVLGLHTVAKHAVTAADQDWLTALGIDFLQSNAVAAPEPIEMLASRSSRRRAP